MVNRRRAAGGAAALLAVAAGRWWILRAPSPEARIEAQLRTLCELVGRKADEKATQTALKSLSLSSLFANPVEIRGDSGPVARSHAPRELAALILRYRVASGTVDLSYADLSVEVLSPEEASIRFTARLRGGSDGPGDTYREVTARLRLVEGEWVFSHFNVVNVMKGQ